MDYINFDVYLTIYWMQYESYETGIDVNKANSVVKNILFLTKLRKNYKIVWATFFQDREKILYKV